MTTAAPRATALAVVEKHRRNLFFAVKREDWESVLKIVRRAFIEMDRNRIPDEDVRAEFRRAGENAVWEQDRQAFAEAWREHARRQQLAHGIVTDEPVD